MKKFQRGLISLVVASTFAPPPAYADELPFDNRFYIAPMGSYALADDERYSDDAYGGALGLGWRVSRYFELEVLGTYLKYDGKTITTPGLIGGLPIVGGILGGLLPGTRVTTPDTKIHAGGIGANVFLFPAAESYASGLFAHVDVMGGDSTLYNAGLGYDWPLTEDIALRAEALYHFDKGDPEFSETQFNIGVRIPLGSRPTVPPPPVEPVQVVEPVEPPLPPPPPPPCQPPLPGQPISLDGCAVGDTLVLRGVNFDFDKDTLTVNAKTLLDQVAEVLLTRPDIKFEIGGHTDGKGSDDYNQKLSERRAISVMNYLSSRNVDAARMSTAGYGESVAVADNETEEGRELNRRVELKVVEAGG